MHTNQLRTNISINSDHFWFLKAGIVVCGCLFVFGVFLLCVCIKSVWQERASPPNGNLWAVLGSGMQINQINNNHDNDGDDVTTLIQVPEMLQKGGVGGKAHFLLFSRTLHINKA